MGGRQGDLRKMFKGSSREGAGGKEKTIKLMNLLKGNSGGFMKYKMFHLFKRYQD